jgi:hypothetical protein
VVAPLEPEEEAQLVLEPESAPLGQRLTVDEGRVAQLQVITRGWFKHPGWHFQRPSNSLVIEATPR